MNHSSSKDEDTVLYQPSHPVQGICSITINRPRRRNAVDSATALSLYEAFIRFEDDASQKIAILSGADGTFCAGADLVAVAESSSSSSSSMLNDAPNMRPLSHLPPPASLLNSTTTSLQPASSSEHEQGQRNRNRQAGPMGPSRLTPSKPIIAAIAGHAVAGGLELALFCDLRVVEESAVLGVFCRRFGVPLIDGGTVRLPAIVGLGRALDLILTGRPVGAQEAMQLGLATRVAAHGRAFQEAVQLAKDLIAFPQLCMLADRESVYNGVFNDQESTGSADGGLWEKLRREFDRGVQVISTESIAGAEKFKAGHGRGGAKL